ncbi:MAG: hypothetical protein ACREM8_09605 [Vulcanimicrobiaceae bacterium]
MMTRLVRKRLIWLGALVFLGYIAYGVWAAGNDSAPPISRTGPVTFGGGIVRGERITTHSWSIAYDKITSDPSETTLRLDGIHDGIIYRKGKPYLRFHAAHATVNSQTQDFTADGKVHIETIDRTKPRTFETDFISWSQALQRLALPHPVTITTRDASKLTIGSLSIDVLHRKIHAENVAGSVVP